MNKAECTLIEWWKNGFKCPEVTQEELESLTKYK
jgi:hypothetical protein